MAESQMRSKITKALAPLHAIAVENPVLPGTPDVNYIEGWVELKWLRSWPVQGGIVRIPHFTPQQRVWHYRRRRAGGQAWFLLQCKREWLLLDGAVAALVINRSTREELIEASEHYWSDGLVVDDLILALETRQVPFDFAPDDLRRLRG
jgi:hypothetical protein